MSRVQCSSVEKLMSPFIDSMVTAGEADMIEGHLSACEPCQRQLQSFISMRSLVARLATPPMPEDMILETRVRLSHARNKNFLVRLENRLSNILKPIVVPVLLGVSLTMLLFGILLGTLASNSTVLAQDRLDEPPLYPLFQAGPNAKSKLDSFRFQRQTRSRRTSDDRNSCRRRRPRYRLSGSFRAAKCGSRMAGSGKSSSLG